MGKLAGDLGFKVGLLCPHSCYSYMPSVYFWVTMMTLLLRLFISALLLGGSFTVISQADELHLPGAAEPGNKELIPEPPSGPLLPDDRDEHFDIAPIHTTTPPASVRGPLSIFNTLMEKSGELASEFPPEKLDKSEFGVVTNREGPSKSWEVHPVVVVPNMPGIQYMWKLKTNFKAPIFVREEFILPEAPSTWKVKSASAQLVDGGRECVMESFQPVDDGWVAHAWTVSPGDPSGLYEIRISLNGKPAHTFVFNVGEPRTEFSRREY